MYSKNYCVNNYEFTGINSNPHSLLPTPYSLLPIPYSLLPTSSNNLYFRPGTYRGGS
ncbi:hypothetical protein [Moorena sp. SIO4G3]|uniref:hypothetical protein n=1 Tax=Moorena sp. SIO4G3 TaxID=2607821 RepID=UPI00142B4CE3|nr:hypothetical protein [Moorena sp. SIO4G3]NEO78382.1 hypothetical protein [Moorena sp. SIO4G3]